MTKVLVIDDEAPIRLLCRVNLEAEGMNVIEAPDGPSGVDKARDERPDVILLDVMMPGLDGWRVAEQLSRTSGRLASRSSFSRRAPSFATGPAGSTSAASTTSRSRSTHSSSRRSCKSSSTASIAASATSSARRSSQSSATLMESE